MAIRQGTDYSKSAIELTNSNEVKTLLMVYSNALADVETAAELLEQTPEHAELLRLQAVADTAKQKIHDAVDRTGSYQDIEAGLYAVKQKRTQTSYDPALVEKYLPEAAAMVIAKTVVKTKIEGLLKGKIITEEQLAECRIITELEPSYIIGFAEKEKEGTEHGDKGTDRQAEAPKGRKNPPGRQSKE